MAYSRRLHRDLDWDLIERIEANGPQKGSRTSTSKLVRKGKSEVRAADTYRGARRNARRYFGNSDATARVRQPRDGFTEHRQIEVGRIGLRAVEEALGGGNG